MKTTAAASASPQAARVAELIERLAIGEIERHGDYLRRAIAA